jgi:hypothetical protein
MSVGAILLPETPNSLVEQGKLEERRKILEEVRGTTNVDAEFADLIDASNEAKAIKNPFRNLLRRKNRPQLIIGALEIPMFQQLTGMNSIMLLSSSKAWVLRQERLFIHLSLLVGHFLLARSRQSHLSTNLAEELFFIEASFEMFSYMVSQARLNL